MSLNKKLVKLVEKLGYKRDGFHEHIYTKITPNGECETRHIIFFMDDAERIYMRAEDANGWTTTKFYDTGIVKVNATELKQLHTILLRAYQNA